MYNAYNIIVIDNDKIINYESYLAYHSVNIGSGLLVVFIISSIQYAVQCTVYTIVGSCALYALKKPNALYALKIQKRTFIFYRYQV